MATERNFISVPLDGRDITDLESRLREYQQAHVARTAPAARGTALVTVHVPTDAPVRAEVLRIIRAWWDGGR